MKLFLISLETWWPCLKEFSSTFNDPCSHTRARAFRKHHALVFKPAEDAHAPCFTEDAEWALKERSLQTEIPTEVNKWEQEAWGAHRHPSLCHVVHTHSPHHLTDDCTHTHTWRVNQWKSTLPHNWVFPASTEENEGLPLLLWLRVLVFYCQTRCSVVL